MTNSLRLRKFAVPENPREIAHPPLRRRIAEVSYLVAFALIGFGVGVAFFWYQTTNDSHVSAEESHDEHPQSLIRDAGFWGA